MVSSSAMHQRAITLNVTEAIVWVVPPSVILQIARPPQKCTWKLLSRGDDDDDDVDLGSNLSLAFGKRFIWLFLAPSTHFSV